MSASFEALARWWGKLSEEDKAHLRRVARSGVPDDRARSLLGGRGALWAVSETYFTRDGRSKGARIAESVREFVLRQSEPGKDG